MKSLALLMRTMVSLPLCLITYLFCLLIPEDVIADSRNEILREVSELERTKDWKIIYGDGVGNLYRYSISERKEILIGAVKDITHGGSYGYPALSRGADNILIWFIEGPPVAVGNSHHFWLVDLQGKRIKEVLKFYQINQASWSPDGVKVVFSGRGKPAPDEPLTEEELQDPVTAFLAMSKHNSLFLLNLLTGEVEKLVEGGVFHVASTQAWSPDSTKFLYSTTDEKLMIYDLSTKSACLLLEKVWSASWSPNGDFIAYRDELHSRRQYTEKPHCYLIHPDGTGKSLLIDNSKKAGAWFRGILPVALPLVWSPDSRFVLYERLVTGLGEHDILYLMRVEDREEVKLAELSGKFNFGNWVGER